MISYKRDVLERQSLSEVKMGRGYPICEVNILSHIFQYMKSGNSLCIIQYIVIYLHNILFCIISNISLCRLIY